MPFAIKTFLDEVSTKGISLKGKIGAVFGSYGWSGEAPQSVLDILKHKYEMHVIEPPIKAKYSPDQKTLHACKDLGQKIAKMLPQ